MKFAFDEEFVNDVCTYTCLDTEYCVFVETLQRSHEFKLSLVFVQHQKVGSVQRPLALRMFFSGGVVQSFSGVQCLIPLSGSPCSAFRKVISSHLCVALIR